MLSCWNIHPDRRPTFRNLTNKLENILLNSEDYLELDTADDDDDTNRCNIVTNSGYTGHNTDAEENDPLVLARYQYYN